MKLTLKKTRSTCEQQRPLMNEEEICFMPRKKLEGIAIYKCLTIAHLFPVGQKPSYTYLWCLKSEIKLKLKPNIQIGSKNPQKKAFHSKFPVNLIYKFFVAFGGDINWFNIFLFCSCCKKILTGQGRFCTATTTLYP